MARTKRMYAKTKLHFKKKSAQRHRNRLEQLRLRDHFVDLPRTIRARA